MSIEMDNPQSDLEKADAAHNLVCQMFLANSIKDQEHFKKAYNQANQLLGELVESLDQSENVS